MYKDDNYSKRQAEFAIKRQTIERLKMKSIDEKCFLVNIVKRNFTFKEADRYDKCDEGKLLKKYEKGETTILRNEDIYGESLEDVKRKTETFVNDDMKKSSLTLIKERAKVEVEKFKEHARNRIRDIDKEIGDLKSAPSPQGGGWTYNVLDRLNAERDKAERLMLHYENEISNTPFGEVNDALIEENRKKKEEARLSLENISNEIAAHEQQISLLEKEEKDLRLELKELDEWGGTREKEESLYESLSTIIRADNIEDYTIEYKELEYIVLENSQSVDLTLQVNEHLVKGWKTLGGIQIGANGGGEGYSAWGNFMYVQSLMCNSSSNRSISV